MPPGLSTHKINHCSTWVSLVFGRKGDSNSVSLRLQSGANGAVCSRLLGCNKNSLSLLFHGCTCLWLIRNWLGLLCFVCAFCFVCPILPTKQKCLFHPLSHSPSAYFWSIQTPSHQVSRNMVFFWEEPHWNIYNHHKLLPSWPCCLLQVRASHTSKDLQVSPLKPVQALILLFSPPAKYATWVSRSLCVLYLLHVGDTSHRWLENRPASSPGFCSGRLFIQP